MMNHYDIDRLRESMVKILGSDGQPVAGSGFIIRSDGYLVTCHHVIYLLDSLKVEYQEQIYAAEWCEELSNPDVDIAILKIDIEDAKAVSLVKIHELPISIIVYGFPQDDREIRTKFTEGFDAYAQNIYPSAPIRTISTYPENAINLFNKLQNKKSWNKLPCDNSTFKTYRIDSKVGSGTSGGLVFARDFDGVVGVMQCSYKSRDESYVIRWDNITEYLDKLGLEPEKNAVCRFLEEIENNFKYDKLLHIPEQPIILKDQYIPIQVTLERKYTHAVETTWGYAESDEELKRAYALKGLEESQPTQVDWKQAKKQHQRIIVLADPGMGKSTLLMREACLTAQEQRQSLKNNTKKLEEVIFPLFLRLSDLAETPKEIIDAIPVLIQRDYSETATQVMELLREKLKVGKCLLLLDALDEVPIEHRKRLVEKLNRFAQRKSPCRIICTSRIVGYSGAFLVGVKEVEIVPFSQKQIEEYIETWFRNAAGYLNDVTVSPSSLIRELRNKPQIRGLAQNPLLLSLICSLYQEKGLTLPARRCEVYEQAVRHMLGKWSKKRNPELNDAWIDAKTELLEELAYQFSCDGKEIFTVRELRKTIDEYLRSGNASTDFDNLNASHLISELSEQDGILQKLHENGDQYLFLHRTFQEYLTACYLNRSRDSIALAKAHFWEYEWHETLSLLAGLMENPVPLLQAITAEKDDIFSTLLLLAGRCIAECPENSHPLIAEIIDKIYKFWQSYLSADFINSTVVALGKVNSQMFQSLQADLNASDSYVRMKAAMALNKISNAQEVEEVEELIDLLNESDSDVRRCAVIILAEIGNAQAVEALIAALNDSNSYVRIPAAIALAEIGNAQAVEALIAALNNSDSEVRIEAAEALAKMGDAQGVEALIAALDDLDSEVRGYAAEALAKMGNAQGMEALIAALDDLDSEVRGYAAEALAKIGNVQAVEALIAALNHSDSYVRWLAAQGLGKIGNAQAVQALIAALNHSDSDVRIEAAEALAKMGDAQGVELLIAALNDSDGDLREQAATALGEIGNAQTLKKLIESLEIDIYRNDIFPLARTLAVRFSKEKLPFIPVYPELVAHKQ